MPAPGAMVAGSSSTTSGRKPATRRPRAAASPAMPAPTTRMRKVIAATPPRGIGHASEPRHYRPPPARETQDASVISFVRERSPGGPRLVRFLQDDDRALSVASVAWHLLSM